MSVQISPRAYTVNQFSQAYNVCRSTVYEEMAAGRLSYRVAGSRHRVIPVEAAEAWLASLPTGADQ